MRDSTSLRSPSIALLIGRWGRWPGWTPLLFRTFALNPTIAFYCLSDTPPAVDSSRLPTNVRHIPLTLPQLLRRLRETVGLKLTTLSASGSFKAGVSAAKTNDLKPMWGVAFADLLHRFDWWGYLQEDLLVGNLRQFATDALLARSDVISPYLPPLNASGVLMLYRNTRRINLLWNKSRDAPRVLRTKTYQVFDEWWGPLEGRDNLARVLGRAASTGEIRLSLSPLKRRWMADDKRYGPGAAVSTNDEFAACWSEGVLWGNAQGAAQHPCAATSGSSSAAAAAGSTTAAPPPADVAVVHISRLKRLEYLSRLELGHMHQAIQRARWFALTSHGLFLPEPSWTNRSMLWASGVLEPGERVRVRTDEVRAHMRGLEARDAYARCKLSAKRAARKGGTGCAALEAAAAAASSSRPCVVASSTRSAHSAAKALGTVRCAAASSSAGNVS